MTSFNITVLQALPETEPTVLHAEFGLGPCTMSCSESCGYTCGALSCTSTCVVEKAVVASAAAVLKAQEEVLKGQGAGE
jgi:hypothetical protein